MNYAFWCSVVGHPAATPKEGGICIRVGFFDPSTAFQIPSFVLPLPSSSSLSDPLSSLTAMITIFTDRTSFATPCSMAICHPHTAYYQPSE
ncbi:hypothetical protein TNCV_3021821 [Trichonephila clavipes]|nr:hypothetical protein TNCV_3021821 [Trichonephila clavipes]